MTLPVIDATQWVNIPTCVTEAMRAILAHIRTDVQTVLHDTQLSVAALEAVVRDQARTVQGVRADMDALVDQVAKHQVAMESQAVHMRKAQLTSLQTPHPVTPRNIDGAGGESLATSQRSIADSDSDFPHSLANDDDDDEEEEEEEEEDQEMLSVVDNKVKKERKPAPKKGQKVINVVPTVKDSLASMLGTGASPARPTSASSSSSSSTSSPTPPSPLAAPTISPAVMAALSSTIADLARQVSDTSSEMGALVARLDMAKDENRAYAVRMDRIDKEIQSIQSGAAGGPARRRQELQQEVLAARKELEEDLKTEVTRAVEKAEAETVKLREELAERIEATNNIISSDYLRTSAVEPLLDAQRRSIDAEMRTEVRAVRQKVDEAAAERTVVEAKMDAEVNAAKSELAVLKGKLDAVNDQLEEQRSETAAVRTSLDTSSTQLREDVENAQVTMAELRRVVGDASAHREADATAIRTIQRKMQQTEEFQKKAMAQLGDRVTDAVGDLQASLTNKFSDLAPRVERLEVYVPALDERVRKLKDMTETVDGRINATTHSCNSRYAEFEMYSRRAELAAAELERTRNNMVQLKEDLTIDFENGDHALKTSISALKEEMKRDLTVAKGSLVDDFGEQIQETKDLIVDKLGDHPTYARVTEARFFALERRLAMEEDLRHNDQTGTDSILGAVVKSVDRQHKMLSGKAGKRDVKGLKDLLQPTILEVLKAYLQDEELASRQDVVNKLTATSATTERTMLPAVPPPSARPATATTPRKRRQQQQQDNNNGLMVASSFAYSS